MKMPKLRIKKEKVIKTIIVIASISLILSSLLPLITAFY